MTRSEGSLAEVRELTASTTENLQVFERELRKWNGAINLVAPSTLHDAWNRHFVDSVQLVSYIPDGTSTVVDLGSGAGFPGLVLGIVSTGENLGFSVTCIEADQRKATFLRSVSRETNAPVTVVAKRIEDAEPQGADLVTARALAPLPRLLPWVHRHLRPGGSALLLKGGDHEKELSDALETWHFTVQKHPSLTNPGSVILSIGDLRRA